MADDEVTVKFQADIAELLSGLQQAQSGLTSAFEQMQSASDQLSEALSGNLAQSADEAKQHLAELGESTANVGETLKGMREEFATAFEFTGIGIAYEGLRQVGDAIERISERGVELRNMSEILGLDTDQTQALSAAANEAGVSVGMLQRGTLKLEETLRAAQGGSGAARETLTGFGLTLDEASSKSTTLIDVLQRVHDRLNDSSTATATMNELTQLLGARSATVAEAFKKFDGSAAAVAEVMGQLNGLTKEQIKQLTEVRGFWASLGEAISNTSAKILLVLDDLARVKVELNADESGGLVATPDTSATDKQIAASRAAADAQIADAARVSQAQTVAAWEAATAQQGASKATLALEIGLISSTVDAFRAGTAQRVQIEQQLYDLTVQRYHADSAEAQTQYAKLLAAQREFADRSAELAKETAERRAEAGYRASEMGLQNAHRVLEAETKDAKEFLDQQLKADEARAKSAEETAVAQIASAQKVLDSELALKTISGADYDSSSIALINAKLAMEEAYFERLKQLRSDDAAAVIQYQGAESKSVAQASEQITQVQTRAAQQVQQQWRSISDGIASSFSSAFDSMLKGTQTFSTAIKNLFTSLVGDIINSSIKTLVTNWLTGQNSMTAASLVWSKITTALHASTAVTTKATDTAQSAGEIQDAASVAAANAFASTAAIPYIGPALAPAAASSALASVMAMMGGLASASGGWAKIPEDQMAMVHANEMVLPANLADGIRKRVAGDEGSHGGSAGGGNHTYNINAHDAKSFDKFLSDKRNRTSLMKQIRKSISNGNRSVR